jgi:hypothetical protein
LTGDFQQPPSFSKMSRYLGRLSWRFFFAVGTGILSMALPAFTFAASEGRNEIPDAEPRDEILDARNREERMDAGTREEVRDSGAREEVQEAGDRQEQLDGESRKEVR